MLWLAAWDVLYDNSQCLLAWDWKEPWLWYTCGLLIGSAISSCLRATKASDLRD